MRVLFVVVLILGAELFAKLPPAVPLLPPRDRGTAVANSKKKIVNPKSSKVALLANVEMGTLLRRDETSSDILGMQLFLGGRASVRFPILIPSLYVKPSLGYFFKRQAEGTVSVVQQVIEGGLTLQYGIFEKNNLQWLLGLSNRFDYSISNIRVYSQSTSGQAFRYRVGPSSGVHFSLSPELKLTTDLEITFSASSPTRMFGGLTTGLAFDL
ncbi:MAG: hypothetical protein FJ116_07825 [Deltaproteobacteria bacterium]|nr:hypothetical protein [Deltaproteobacteria bacterium]